MLFFLFIWNLPHCSAYKVVNNEGPINYYFCSQRVHMTFGLHNPITSGELT